MGRGEGVRGKGLRGGGGGGGESKSLPWLDCPHKV